MNLCYSQPIPIIFDTDMAGDVDDAGALAVLHALADNGEAKILAAMLGTASDHGAGCIDAINTYYGRPNLPVGAYKGSLRGDSGKFAREITDKYPNDFPNREEVPDATTLYRQILASQPDTSVTIVTVGFLFNLERLLKSKADKFSPLNGKDLVAKKVAKLVSMGGKYPSGNEYNFSLLLKWEPIGNITKYSIDNWPTPITFTGVEIGTKIFTGAALASTPTNNPVREAYKLYLGGLGKNRKSWDQTAVLYAVRGLQNYWTSVSDGYNHIYPDGTNEWKSSPDKNHAYLVQNIEISKIEAEIEGLMIQPPKCQSEAFQQNQQLQALEKMRTFSPIKLNIGE